MPLAARGHRAPAHVCPSSTRRACGVAKILIWVLGSSAPEGAWRVLKHSPALHYGVMLKCAFLSNFQMVRQHRALVALNTLRRNLVQFCTRHALHLVRTVKALTTAIIIPYERLCQIFVSLFCFGKIYANSRAEKTCPMGWVGVCTRSWHGKFSPMPHQCEPS